MDSKIACGGRLCRASFLHVYGERDGTREGFDCSDLAPDRCDAEDVFECVTAGLDRASRNAADVEVMFPYDVSELYSSYLKTFSHEPSGIDLVLEIYEGVLVQSVLIAVHLDGSLSCVKCQKSRAYPS